MKKNINFYRDGTFTPSETTLHPIENIDKIKCFWCNSTNIKINPKKYPYYYDGKVAFEYNPCKCNDCKQHFMGEVKN